MNNTITIEIHTPDGIRTIEAPSSWTIHDVAVLRQIIDAVGYVGAVPKDGALFAYRPKGIEVNKIPASLAVRMTQIPGTRVTQIETTASGYRGVLTDYATGKVADIRIEDIPAVVPLREAT